MPTVTQVTNCRGEEFKLGDVVLNISHETSGRMFGLSMFMREHRGKWFEIRHFGTRKSVMLKGSDYTWHVDDFTFDESLCPISCIKTSDVDKNLMKWLRLDGKLYHRYHSNIYMFYIDDPKQPGNWDTIANSPDESHYEYKNSYDPPVWVLDKEGTNAYAAMKVSTTSCFGGFTSTYHSFYKKYRKRPTHTIQKLRMLTADTIREIYGSSKPPSHVIYPTPYHWKEAMLNFKRGDMIPEYWDLDEIFGDCTASEYHFKIDLRDISKEKWYWYASMARQLAENPQMLHGFNGLCRDFPKMHPIMALCLTAAVYASRTHAAVECNGLLYIDKQNLSVSIKEIAEYTTRVGKFLKEMPGDCLLKEEKLPFPMWRIFRFFRAQSGDSHSVYDVSVPKTASADLDSLLAYNPITRRVKR